MREIKFRAWDKITKKYFYSGTLDNGDILVIHLDGEIEISSDDTYKPEDFIIEQFTGLRDKNGCEIYEGDICTYTSYWQDEEYILRSTTAISVVCWGPYYDDATAISATCWLYASDGMPVESFENEIIGNIHENPELLS